MSRATGIETSVRRFTVPPPEMIDTKNPAKESLIGIVTNRARAGSQGRKETSPTEKLK
jgi:hypothetical protein